MMPLGYMDDPTTFGQGSHDTTPSTEVFKDNTGRNYSPNGELIRAPITAATEARTKHMGEYTPPTRLVVGGASKSPKQVSRMQNRLGADKYTVVGNDFMGKDTPSAARTQYDSQYAKYNPKAAEMSSQQAAGNAQFRDMANQYGWAMIKGPKGNTTAGGWGNMAQTPGSTPGSGQPGGGQGGRPAMERPDDFNLQVARERLRAVNLLNGGQPDRRIAKNNLARERSQYENQLQKFNKSARRQPATPTQPTHPMPVGPSPSQPNWWGASQSKGKKRSSKR